LLWAECGSSGRDESCFQGLNDVLTLIQSCNRINLEIHAESMARLIRHELRGGNSWIATKTT